MENNPTDKPIMQTKDIPSYQPTPKVQPKELRLTPKQKGLALMLSEGVTVKDAAKSLGMNEKYCYGLKKNLERYDLTSSKMLSLAHKAVKSIVQGLPVGESEAPKPSTILDAARMSMDRAYPLKTISESNNLHTFIEVKVDMDRYKQGKVVDAQVKDAEPC